MRQIKVLPTSELVDSIFNDNYIPKKKDEMYFHDNSDKIKGRKLTPHNVDMIRYLQHIKVKNSAVSQYFNIPRCVPVDISRDKFFYKHVSPFQTPIGKYKKELCQDKLNIWKDMNKEDLDVFMKWYLDEYIPNFNRVSSMILNK